MNANQLTIGTQLQGRTSRVLSAIEDYQPPFRAEPAKWQLRGKWLTLEQVEERFIAPNHLGRTKSRQKKGVTV